MDLSLDAAHPGDHGDWSDEKPYLPVSTGDQPTVAPATHTVSLHGGSSKRQRWPD